MAIDRDDWWWRRARERAGDQGVGAHDVPPNSWWRVRTGGNAPRPGDAAMFAKALASLQLTAAAVALLWLAIQPASTFDTVGIVAITLGAAVLAALLLSGARLISARSLPPVAFVGTALLAGYTYFGGDPAFPFGFFYMVSATAAIWYLPDSAALAQIGWMVVAYGLAIWCRVYPGEQPWPSVSTGDADLLLVWGVALIAAALLISLFKRRVIDVDQRLAAIVESSPDAIIGVDRSGRLTVWNAGAERMFGYAASEAVGLPMNLLVPPGNEGVQDEVDRRVLAGEQIDRYVTERVRKDGSRVTVSIAVAPLRDAAGRVAGRSCIIRDLTAETAAAQTIALQARLLDEIDTAVVLSDSRGMVQYCNHASEELYGYTPEELAGRNLLDLIFPAGLRATATDFRRASSSDAPSRREFDIVDKQGNALPIDVRIRKVEFDRGSGPELGSVSVATDITERRAAERVIVASRAHLQLAQEAAGMGSWQRDLETRRVLWSGAVAALHNLAEGVPPAMEALATSVSSEDWELLGATIERCEETGAEAECEYRVLANERGGERIIAARISQRDDAEAGVHGVLGVCQDVTERSLRENAERMNRAKSEFLSRMSHELRTPLNAILGFGQLLERAPIEDRYHGHAGHVVTAGRHLLSLIDEVLEISRIESGSLGISMEPVLIADAAQESVALVRPIAAEHGVALEADLSAITGVYVRADLQRVKQVVLNLLSNAIKYNRPGGSVRVTADVEGGDAVVLRVTDTGLGIAPGDIPRLFIPFDRLGAEASEIEGTGLGLALSLSLIEEMDGTLHATSELGTGSTFELRLRRGERPAPAVDRPAEGTPPQSLRDLRVLYIEDNVANLRLIEEVLAEENVEIIAAANGRLALDLAPSAGADVILLDINLPDMTGDEVLRRLRASPQTATTPVIVLTADATPSTGRRMLELGANAHLTKPIDIDVLKAALAKVSPELAGSAR